MVRNYVQKTNRGSWDEENMKLAYEAVKSKEMSIRKASATFNVPKDTLNRQINGKLKTLPNDALFKKVMGAYRKVLSDEQEHELADYIRKMDSAFYGISIPELQRIVYDYAEKNKIENNFNKEKK